MFGVRAKSEMYPGRVIAAAQKFGQGLLERRAKRVQKIAQDSIKQSPDPSLPGTPPHTRAGALPRAIGVAAGTRLNARFGMSVGPMYSKFGRAAEPHEFGKTYKGRRYRKRAFMRPALESEAN